MRVVDSFFGCGRAVLRGALAASPIVLALACAKPAPPACPADTSAALSAEVRALSAELAMVRAQQQRSALIESEHRATAEREAHATLRLLERTPEQQRRLHHLKLRAVAASLRAELLAQWRDEVWATTMEIRAKARVAQLRPPGLTLDRIRCASTMCELSFSAISEQAAEGAGSAIPALLQQGGTFTSAFEYDFEKPAHSKVNVFVSRSNHALRVPDVGPDERFE